MKTTVQLEWTDYLAALRLHANTSAAFVVILVMGALGLVYWTIAGVSAALQGNFAGLGYLAPLYIVVGVFLLGYFVLGPYNAKRIFNQTQELKDPQEVEVLPEGLRQTTPLSQALRPWSNFTKWKEDKHLFLLYISNIQFIMLPKRAVPDAMLAQIRGYLAATPRPPQPRGLLRWGVRGCLIYTLVVIAIIVLLFQFRSQAH